MKFKFEKLLEKHKRSILIIAAFLIAVATIMFFTVDRTSNKYYDFELKDIPHCYSGSQEFCWINDNQKFDGWEYRFQIRGEDRILIIRNMTKLAPLKEAEEMLR